MKGLKEYIAKHGFHFTVELAYKAGGKKWSSKQVMDAAQRKVYYNVTSSTEGDMTYSANVLYSMGIDRFQTLNSCVKVTLAKVGCYALFAYGGIFSQWLGTMQRHGEEIDFTPYI